jgi:hypothetical protein
MSALSPWAQERLREMVDCRRIDEIRAFLSNEATSEQIREIAKLTQKMAADNAGMRAAGWLNAFAIMRERGDV